MRAAGFDHTTQGSYAIAAGVSKALELNNSQTANAIGICGTAFNALRVTRTGRLSHWKGLAYPNASAACTFATFLASRGTTGPLEVFEGEKGFMDAISGAFYIDWSLENLERVTRTILKKHNAEVHSQTAIECGLQLRAEKVLDPTEIEHIDVETFDVAYNIIGGGDEGDKTFVSTKEEADHSLPYLISVALLDGNWQSARNATHHEVLRANWNMKLGYRVHRSGSCPCDRSQIGPIVRQLWQDYRASPNRRQSGFWSRGSGRKARHFGLQCISIT